MSDQLLDPNHHYEIKIEKLSFGGNGVGRINNIVVFVPLAAPGDTLKIQITQNKDKYCFAKIIEIIKPSEHRVQPECPVYGVCGGCSLQHVSYEEQLKQKQNIVQEELSKSLKGLAESGFQVLPIIASEKPYRYRNRIQLKFDEPKIGFYTKRTNEIVDIDDCPIAEEVLAAQIPLMRKKLIAEKKKKVDKVELFLDQKTGAPSVNLGVEDEKNPGESSIGFSQVNRFQNLNLQNSVNQILEKNPTNLVYDLYAGSGNFSFDVIQKFKKTSVIAVELSSASVESAQKRIREQNLSPKVIRFFMSDVELFLKRNALVESATVLLDPPRVGCSEEVIRLLSVQKVKKIIYISCNPTTLGRDLQRLFKISSKKWKISKIQPFDMFPQTGHVEVLVELDIDSE